MALIRGLKGKFPCPICLVPQDLQAIFSDNYMLRTAAESQKVLNMARAKSLEMEKESDLKSHSLRDVEVCCLSIITRHSITLVWKNVFWKVPHCDVHRALSFDRLHAHNAGLWHDHLWKEVQFWIADLGREAAVQTDTKFVLSDTIVMCFLYNLLHF